MAATNEYDRPNVIILVIISVLIALPSLVVGADSFYTNYVLQSDPTLGGRLSADPASVAIRLQVTAVQGVMNSAVGVLDLVVAFLILKYKRIGLFLAIITFIIGILWNLFNAVIGSGDLFIIVSILIEGAMLYYVWRYLTREPEKSFFT